MNKLDISKIVQSRLKPSQFFAEKFPKKQIVLHHTVSNGNANNVQSWWAKTPAKIGTAFIIDGDGVIYQCFSSAEWCHHLGTKAKNNTTLNKESIGIEICNWGALTKGGYTNGKKWIDLDKNSFYSFSGTKIDSKEVVDYGEKWRGFQYFHKYNDKQIEATRQLVEYLCDTYKIDKTYKPDMWYVSKDALSGKNGIYTHVSYRGDKSDCHKQPELIEMLKNI